MSDVRASAKFGALSFVSWRGHDGSAERGEMAAYQRYCAAFEVDRMLSSGCGGMGTCSLSGRRCAGCSYFATMGGGCFGECGNESCVGTFQRVVASVNAPVGSSEFVERGLVSSGGGFLGYRCDDFGGTRLPSLGGCVNTPENSSGSDSECVVVGSVKGDGSERESVGGVLNDGFAVVDVGVNTKSETGVLPEKKKKKKMGKNQRDRAKRLSGEGSSGDNWRVPKIVPVVGGLPVRLSLEKKWEAENQVAIAKADLAKAKAKKDLEFQLARDVDAEVKKNRARIVRETESSKVATEKAFASLRASGNVPGFCATVLSEDGVMSPECTVSPDSSASMHEFREAQKQILDLQKENEDSQKEIKDLTRQLRLGKLLLGEEVTFSAKSDGDASEELTKALDGLENDHFYVDRSEDPACFGVNKTIYAKRVYIDAHSYDGDY